VVRPDDRRRTMTRVQLSGADLYDWIALRRVNDGGVAKMGDRWFDGGRPVPGYVADALTALRDKRLLVLAEVDVWCMQRAALTDAGTVRYKRLCEKRETRRPLPAPESDQSKTWLADHPPAHKVVRSVCDTLAEMEQSGHHLGAIAALRRVLAYHQPTPAGRCRACRRWRWRRRGFPCIVWHQIYSALRENKLFAMYPASGCSTYDIT
jgi:hypothetical protein